MVCHDMSWSWLAFLAGHSSLHLLKIEAFLAGLLAESMYITSHGSFVLYDSLGQALSVLEQVIMSACLNHAYKIQ